MPLHRLLVPVKLHFYTYCFYLFLIGYQWQHNLALPCSAMDLPPLLSLTLLSQTWNSWRSSLRVSTGSSWSVEVAVRLSPSIPESAVPMTATPPQRTAPHPFPVSPVLPSCQCCFNITPPLCSSLPLSCLIVPSHPASGLAPSRRLCPSDHTPHSTQANYNILDTSLKNWPREDRPGGGSR